MSSFKPGVKTKSLSDRIGGLEQNLARVIVGINNSFRTIGERLSNVEELVDAVMEIQGRAEVEKVINDKRLERAEALVNQEKTSLEQAVQDGYVVAASVVGEKSIVIGKFLDPEGVVIQPGRVQLLMTGAKPDFSSQLLAKGVGTVAEMEGKERFELTEIYDVDQDKAKAFFEAKAAAVNESVKAAAATESA